MPKNIGTHDGKFHADEAFAIALLQLTSEFADSKITRTRDPEVLKTMDIVVDVGGEYDPQNHRYDHHQPTFHDTFSPDHVTLLSSAGLIYKHFAKEIFAKKLKSPSEVDLLYKKLYESFVEAFDAHDNGISAYPSEIKPKFQRPWDIFSQVNILNPAWNEQDVDANIRFMSAVKLVKENFESVLNFYSNSWLPGRSILENCFTAMHSETEHDQRILVLDQFCPWVDHLFDLENESKVKSPIIYTIFEDSMKRSWRVQAVPKDPGSFECRLALPKEWRGLRDDELDSVTGLKGCVFVHRAGFIGAHTTKEGAIKMAKLSLDTQDQS